MDTPPAAADRRAVSSPIGIVLLIGMTLAGAVGIVVMGGATLEDAQEDSRVGQAEHALTQFDSKAAQVALGESDSQTVSLGSNRGNYRIDEDAGSLKIYHVNWTGDGSDDTEYIYGTESDGVTFGSVIYEVGNTEIAYQGGGVWRKDSTGGARMVSPPEFHYRDATLTFPIIRVSGAGSASGDTRARVSQLETANDIYPDQRGVTTNVSDQYASDSNRTYVNPVQEGDMVVEITSEYCQAWRSYFVDRTEGEVSECDANGTVTAEIVALGTQGSFSVTNNGEVLIRGLEGDHPLETLDFTFYDSEDSNSGFNNFRWEMSGTDNAGNEIGVFLKAQSYGNLKCDEGETSNLRTVIYYNNASTDTYTAFNISHQDDENAFKVRCDANGEEYININLLNESRNATYGSLNGDDPFSEESGLNSSDTFDQHGVDGGETYYSGDRANLSYMLNHYFGRIEGGEADLYITESVKGNSGVSESSSGEIEYEGGGKVVTFLHITENKVEVRVE